MNVNPAIEDIELSLIEADVNDVAQALRGPRAQDHASIPALLIFPVAGLVAEESHRYFSRHRRSKRFGSLEGDLFDVYGESLTKVRARLKLFDDTDRGPGNLVSFLNFVQQQSRVLFSHPSSSVLQWLSAPFRPDLGAFFADDVMVATTHALLPAMGVGLDLLRNTRPGQFADFHAFAFDFARAMDAHWSQLASVLNRQGRNVNLRPEPITGALSFTHNDFVAKRFYRHVKRGLPAVFPAHVPALTLCLGQVNVALYVLPQLLGLGSGLVVRAQYLAAYHGSRALEHAMTSPPDWVQPGADHMLSSPGFGIFLPTTNSATREWPRWGRRIPSPRPLKALGATDRRAF